MQRLSESHHAPTGCASAVATAHETQPAEAQARRAVSLPVFVAFVFTIGFGFGFGFDLTTTTPLLVERNDLSLYVSPASDPLATLNNDLWAAWHDQRQPTPPISETLFTLYGYSELAWGVANLRALDYEQCRSYGTCVHSDLGELYVVLRDCGVAAFRDCLNRHGLDGVVALKADDVGRRGTVSFYDTERQIWTAPLNVLVLDSLGAGWDRLRRTHHPFNDHVSMTWGGDVAKDLLEQAGLSRLVENNQSGFMRLVLDDAVDRFILWPDY